MSPASRAVGAAALAVAALTAMALSLPRAAWADDAVAWPAPPVVLRGWQVALTGFVQVDMVAWSQASVDDLDPSTGQPLNQERFVIPRARLRVEARRDAVFGVFELDGNTLDGATARLLAAQVGWTLLPGSAPRAPATPPLLTVSAGLFTIPWGNEVASDVREKPFLEPPAVSRALFPGNFDAGAMAQGGYGYLRWVIAAMNGAPVGDLQWKGKDPTSSYDFLGRLGADVPLPLGLRVEAGVSALDGTGLSPGIQPTKDSIQWVDENQNGLVDPTEIQIIPGSPGEPSQTYKRNALGADVMLHWQIDAIGGGTAFFEGALATNLDRALVYSDPVASARDLRQLGYFAGATQFVGPHLLVGARYDRYDADRDAMDREGAVLVDPHKIFSTLAVMVSGRWDAARITAEYDRVRNPFGRADNGAPTTRAADQVTVRAQVGF